MSGQRGINTGMNIDGTDSKSAFFGYGRGGEATENDGLVVAQDSVREFQIITSGFNPEVRRVRRRLHQRGHQVRHQQRQGYRLLLLPRRQPGRGHCRPRRSTSRAATARRRRSSTFDRDTYGGSIGGPIVKDRTHYFFSFDQVNRDVAVHGRTSTPRAGTTRSWPWKSRSLGSRPWSTATRRTSDGIAAPDDELGRTATGTFTRDRRQPGPVRQAEPPVQRLEQRLVPHQLHRLRAHQRLEGRRVRRRSRRRCRSSPRWCRSSAPTRSTSFASSWPRTSSTRVVAACRRAGRGDAVRFRNRDEGRDDLGKFYFLPILVEEDKLQIQNNFSYIFGEHDLKFGIDYQQDDLAQLCSPGAKDGRYYYGNTGSAIEDFPQQRRLERPTDLLR